MAATARYPLVKLIAASRRKPHMTHGEFLDYHYQVHGAIADSPQDANLKPYRYIQSHTFDSAFSPRSNGPVNANQTWVGRDDATELWFRDLDHMMHVFRSEFTQKTVGPDALNFADLETSINMMGLEKSLKLPSSRSAGDTAYGQVPGEHAVTALYFVASSDGATDGPTLEAQLSPLLTAAIEQHSGEHVTELLVNVGLALPDFDPVSYFGGASMPKYALVYKLYLRDADGVVAVRKAQHAFEEKIAQVSKVDVNGSFILFNKEAFILDVESGITFDRARQPIFKYV